MNPEQAISLCKLASAASPAQRVDEYTPDLWVMVLEPYRFEDARIALRELAAESEWIHVSHVVKRIRKIRSKRVNDFGMLPDPPAGLEATEYHAWYTDTVRRIADGEVVQRPALPPAGDVAAHRERLDAIMTANPLRSVND
jgi:hypothetical protein